MGRTAIDITGQRFSRLTAIRRVEDRNKKAYWLFRCDCGVEKEIRKNRVTTGKIKSCGCLLNDIRIKGTL